MAPMRCTKCGLELEGKYMRFDGNVYHPECLTCEDCGEPVQRVHKKHGKRLCEKCAIEVCSQCKRPMTTGGFFNGKHWCNDCFVCSSCHGKLETAYTSREMPGKIFCKDCLSHRCSTCQKVIHGRSMNFEGQHHCLECFVCVRCGFGFPDGRVYKKDCGKVCSRCIHRPVDVAESPPPPAAESNTNTRRRLVVKAAKDSETVWQWQGGYIERGRHCGKPLFVRDCADGGVEYVIYYHPGFARWFLGKKVCTEQSVSFSCKSFPLGLDMYLGVAYQFWTHSHILPMEEGSSESSLDEEEVGYAATRIRSISVQTDDGGRAHTLILEEYEELHNDDRMFEARHFALGNLAAKLAHWRPRVGGDLAQATLITLCGHLAPPLTAPFAFGAFTGVLSPKLAPGYHWLALLLLVGCILWLLVSHFKVFVGFGGRVGFTAFCSCYLVQAVVLMPVGAVEYRAVNILADMLLDGAKVASVRVAYEQRVWQKDVISVLAPVFGAVTANFLRSCGASLENPITGATSGSLTAFLVLSVSGWSFAPVAMNGFAVGSFVGMASFEYLPTTSSWDIRGPADPADSADDLLESRPDRPKQPQQAQRTQRTQRTICGKVGATAPSSPSRPNGPSGLSGRIAGKSPPAAPAGPADPADSADDLLESRRQQPQQAQRTQRTQRTICWKVGRSLDDASSPELCSWEQDNLQAIVEKTQMDAWDEKDQSLFYDKTFPHRQIPSIDGPGATATGLAQPMWVPARRLHRGQWRLFDGIDPLDLLQGKVGNCWLMAALAALAEYPKAVEKVFKVDGSQTDGRFVLQLFDYRCGQMVDIVVDEYIPCAHAHWWADEAEPYFSQPHGNEMWCLILEKALAKLFGSYAHLAEGSSIAIVAVSVPRVNYLEGCLDAFDLENRYCLVLYETERRWHERLLIRKTNQNRDGRSPGWFVVATPEGDVYAESLAPPNVVGVIVLPDNRQLPPGLLARSVHRFENGSVGHAPTGAELAHLRGTAHGELMLVQAEIDGLDSPVLGAGAAGTPVPAPAANTGPAPVALTPVAGYTWVVAAAEGSRAKGSILPLGQVVSGQQFGSKGVAALVDGSVVFAELIPSHEVGKYGMPVTPVASGGQPNTVGLHGGALAINQADDARTLAVRYGSDGKRRRELRDGVDQSSETAWTDWPIKGPRTARWVAQYIVTNGGAPLSMHQAWKTNCKLQASDGGVLEHEAICKVLELAIEYDQLNVGELAAVELLCRRLQMIQYRWRERILGATATGTIEDESHFFMGTDPTRGNLCICPSLNTWLGEELHKESQMNKEQRKAREERALLRSGKSKP
ncbi:Calpain-15 [Symbiodinium microadriaticum]|uniref:Calpain-15 n=1 Tax=Symbiodinium microadriaticum TaxID=2951 RepID=A0A1Q9EU52_SYMMI|nr:Calpain-15 [Symbiodinium microadriaticum]